MSQYSRDAAPYLGFRVGYPEKVPGFRVKADGSVGGTGSAGTQLWPQTVSVQPSRVFRAQPAPVVPEPVYPPWELPQLELPPLPLPPPPDTDEIPVWCRHPDFPWINRCTDVPPQPAPPPPGAPHPDDPNNEFAQWLQSRRYFKG